MQYFLIWCNEDGLKIEAMSETELLKAITPGKYGDHNWGEQKITFLETFPDLFEPWTIGDAKIVIKGTVIVPKPVEVVTKYTL